MRSMALVLMLSGFAIVIAALGMLSSLGQRFVFVVAGLGVEALGLAILAHNARALQKARP